MHDLDKERCGIEDYCVGKSNTSWPNIISLIIGCLYSFVGFFGFVILIWALCDGPLEVGTILGQAIGNFGLASGA